MSDSLRPLGILQAGTIEWGDLPNPEIEPRSPALQADSIPSPGGLPDPGIEQGSPAGRAIREAPYTFV